MEHKYLFGKFRDKGKDKTLSFRVSKETHDLFKKHADYNFGDVAKGLKEIFIDYMSQHAFRRQTLTHNVKMFIPKCDEDDFKNQIYLPCDSYNVGITNIPFDLLDLENVIIDSHVIRDYSKLDLSIWSNKDSYEDDSGWVSKTSSYNIDDGFIVEFSINNQLDRDKNGVYCINDEKDEENNTHEGLVIINYEDVVYYVDFLFTIDLDDVSPINLISPQLITNEEAFERAWECGNLELAKLIDGFKEGISNIEHDKQLLLEKRENLILQVEEIDDKLSKF